MKKTCCALLSLLPLLAQAFPIELEQQLNGAEVVASGQAIDQDMAAVRLFNRGQTEVSCKALFRNGPEAPRTRSIRLAAGKGGNLTVTFARSVVRLRVQLTCTPRL